MKLNAQRDERRVTNATSSVLLKALSKRFKWNYVEHIQWWRRWWYQKGGCSAGRFHENCECVDWAWERERESTSVCVCLLWFFFTLNSYFAFYPFNSIIQWCTSRQIVHVHTHTHIPHATHTTQTCTLFKTFLFMLQQHLWRLLPVSAVLLLPEFSVWNKKKFSVYDSCLWIWYPHSFWLLAADNNIVCKEREHTISIYT